MDKGQNYGRILILLVVAWILYSCYELMRGRVIEKEAVSNVEMLRKLGPIHSKKMTNQEIRERLGRSTWALLHTMGATYPAFPTARHKMDTMNFIYLLSSK